MKKLLGTFLLSFLLSACGFHLRGVVVFPAWFKDVAVVSQEVDSIFASVLRARLESAKVRLVDVSEARYRLVIEAIRHSEQLLSVGASTKPRQYRLYLEIRFHLESKAGRRVLPSQVIITTRQVTINNDRILGSTNEESILEGEMKEDAVSQLISRLAHQL